MLCGCMAHIPGQASANDTEVRITPDYIDITVPFNIAPLDFRVMEPAEKIVADIYSDKGKHITLRARKKNIDIPAAAWHRLLSENKGGKLYIDIYTYEKKKWTLFRTIENQIADEPTDPWISYRLADYGYTGYGETGLYQRSLESYKERLIFSNRIARSRNEEEAVGFHTLRGQDPSTFLFHMRDAHAGTVLIQNDEIQKLVLSADSLDGQPGFAAIHPTLPLVAFSVSHELLVLHSMLRERMDLISYASDLVLYDMSTQRLTPITQTTDRFETQPAWSPDGTKLYFCSAECPEWSDTASLNTQISTAYTDIRYDLLSMSFNPSDHSFGGIDTVYPFARQGVSASYPAPSPDGKYMMLSLSRYGTFPDLQQISDIYIMNLETSEMDPLQNVNGKYADSYHAWSSNGRWIVTSSYSDDGAFSRPFFAYFGADGKTRKAFLLPCRRQMEHVNRLSSYWYPAFMTSPVSISRETLRKAAEEAPETYISLQP